MAKTRRKLPDRTNEGPSAYTAASTEPLPGETLADYDSRMNAEEAEARAKEPEKFRLSEDETWDPHMGCL